MSEQLQVDGANAWRLQTPGTTDWPRTARPDDPDKYLMISADTHANEPAELWRERIEPKYRDRVPHVRKGEKGDLWSVVEGNRPTKIRIISMVGQDEERNGSGATSRGVAPTTSATESMPKSYFPTKAWPCGRRRTQI